MCVVVCVQPCKSTRSSWMQPSFHLAQRALPTRHAEQLKCPISRALLWLDNAHALVVLEQAEMPGFRMCTRRQGEMLPLHSARAHRSTFRIPFAQPRLRGARHAAKQTSSPVARVMLQ